MPGAPTVVSLASGAESLTVTFTADASLLEVDTFAYKLYALGDTIKAVGNPDGYVVPRQAARVQQ